MATITPAVLRLIQLLVKAAAVVAAAMRNRVVLKDSPVTRTRDAACLDDASNRTSPLLWVSTREDCHELLPALDAL